MQKPPPTGYSLATLCSAIGARLGLPLADQLRVQSRVADRGMGSTYVLETDTTETPKFRMCGSVESAVERPAIVADDAPVSMRLTEAAEWLARELQPATAPQPLTLCMSDGLPVPEPECERHEEQLPCPVCATVAALSPEDRAVLDQIAELPAWQALAADSANGKAK